MQPMKLWQRSKHKTWYASFERCKRFPVGKRISLKTKDKKEALSIFKALKKKWLENRLFELDGSRRISIKDFIKEYTDHPDRKNLSENTLRMDRLALNSLGDVIGPNSAIKTINYQKISLFKKTCSARKLAKSTTNTYLRHIKAALNTAREWGYIEKVSKIKPLKVGKHLPATLSREEINKILEYSKKADHEMWRIISFALWTGCRRQEILNLKWQDVSENTCRIIGKGDKERVVYFLPDALKAMGTKRHIGLVFKKMHKDTVSHKFKDLATACNIKSNFHNLRHTAATHMIKNGIPIEIIQKILGHSDIRTTQIYAQIYDDVIAKEMSKLKY